MRPLTIVFTHSHGFGSVSIDPQAKNDALLLSTNTEVSISPKLHSNKQARTAVANGAADAVEPKPTAPLSSQILRVLPAHILSKSVVSYSGPEVVGYVSFSALARIYSTTTATNNKSYYKVSLKRLEPPVNPEASTLQNTDPVPETRVLNPGEKDQQTGKDSDKADVVYICGRDDLVDAHVLFPVLPSGVEHWDLIRYIQPASSVIHNLDAP